MGINYNGKPKTRKEKRHHKRYINIVYSYNAFHDFETNLRNEELFNDPDERIVIKVDDYKTETYDIPECGGKFSIDKPYPVLYLKLSIKEILNCPALLEFLKNECKMMYTICDDEFDVAFTWKTVEGTTGSKTKSSGMILNILEAVSDLIK